MTLTAGSMTCTASWMTENRPRARGRSARLPREGTACLRYLSLRDGSAGGSSLGNIGMGSGSSDPDSGSILRAEYACAMKAVDDVEGCRSGDNRLLRRWSAYVERNELENLLHSARQRRDTEVHLLINGNGDPGLLADLEESVVIIEKRFNAKRKDHDRLRKGSLYARLAGVLCKELDRRSL